MLEILGNHIGLEFQLIEEKFPFLNITFDGAAMDKEKKCMLVPSSSYAFPPEFARVPLDSLIMGIDERGLAVVGSSKTLVPKKNVDGFVHAMEDVYYVKWKEIYALVHRKKPYPIVLIANPWTFAIAPIIQLKQGFLGVKEVSLEDTSWMKGKYDPEAWKAGKGDSCRECAYSNGYLIEIPKASLSGILTGIQEYDLKEHWVCTKFNLSIDGRLGIAQKCTSYLTQEQYEKKCLSGEMEQIKPVSLIDCAYCHATYDIAKNPSCPICGARQKKIR